MKKCFLSFLVLLGVVIMSANAFADAWKPSSAVTIYCVSAAGGATDYCNRAMAVSYILPAINSFRTLAVVIVKTLIKFYNKKIAYKLRTLGYRNEGHTLSQTSGFSNLDNNYT